MNLRETVSDAPLDAGHGRSDENNVGVLIVRLLRMRVLASLSNNKYLSIYFSRFVTAVKCCSQKINFYSRNS